MLIPPPRDDITAKLLCSSVTDGGARIDTLQLHYPRIVHAEFMTHRVFSRNASSSRAIPTTSILVRDADIFVPLFRKNQPGMQPGDYLTDAEQAEAAVIWADMAEIVTRGCRKLADKAGLNVHKQWSNRPLEWFGYIDVLATSTDWENWDHLRDHGAAQDEIRILCRAMKDARDATTPQYLPKGRWHLPYITADDIYCAQKECAQFSYPLNVIFHDTRLADISMVEKLLIVASAARACRVSYSKLDGTPSTFSDDIDRFFKLMPANSPVHASPLEHQATPLGDWCPGLQGNFNGFAQFRKFIPNEAHT